MPRQGGALAPCSNTRLFVMKRSRVWKKAVWLSVIAVGAALVILVVDGRDGFQRLEWMTEDFRSAQFRHEAEIHPDLALILIDEASLSLLNPVLGRFPWPRSVYADLLEFLAEGNPRAVVFDVLFTENQWLHGQDRDQLSEEDEALLMATAAAGNVHHSLQLIHERPDEVDEDALDQPLPDEIRQQHALNGVTGLEDEGRNSYMLPFEPLGAFSAGLGAVGLDADADGVFRRVRPLFTYQDEIFPALSTTALKQQVGLGEARFQGRDLLLPDRHVPLDDSGRMRVNFYGDIPAWSFGGIFRSLGSLRRGEPEAMLVPPDAFEDRIVFIGGSAVGLHDIKHTPLSSRTPGVEIHMAAASNLLMGDYLRPSPAWLTPLLVVLFAGVTAASFAQGRVWRQLTPPLLLLAAHLALVMIAFQYHHLVDLVAPSSALLLTGLACMAYVSATEGRDRRRVRRMLSQYVSPAVLAEVVDRYDEHVRAEVGTEERMTILFSDIRGFTTISEGFSPEQVVEMLNRYLSELSEAIFFHEGTLDKFIGDAIMAFWGAPIRVPDHAERAVSAALAMQERLEILNQALLSEGLPALRTGVGLHTGSVILGNIGSERKLDYTVIGDNVNLASRLEGLTSHYGCPVLISEDTAGDLGEGFVCALVDRVRVKGRQQAIGIWRPLVGPDADNAQREQALEVRHCSQLAWETYRERDWSAAIAAWERLPEGDPLRSLFVARCRRYQDEGVAADWDGVYRLDSK